MYYLALVIAMTKLSSHKTCKILFLEDDSQDVELMLHELEVAGISTTSRQVYNKQAFVEALENFQPDIILADYTLPMFNGMHAFRIFKERGFQVPFVLVTGALSEELALEYLNEGIDDFILKSSYKRLPTVITRNLELKKAQTEKENIAAELQKKTEELRHLHEKAELTKAHDMLSQRELEVLRHIASGSSTKEIADRLYLSPATVATYRARIMEKMDLRSNVDLTRYALRNNLID
jgi:DNA-binding NarL/FixJ family response regulator